MIIHYLVFVKNVHKKLIIIHWYIKYNELGKNLFLFIFIYYIILGILEIHKIYYIGKFEYKKFL